MLVWRSLTVEEDQEDTRVEELFAAQQVDVFYTEVKGQFDDGAILHVGGDVCHQSQVLHQTTGLYQQEQHSSVVLFLWCNVTCDFHHRSDHTYCISVSVSLTHT